MCSDTMADNYRNFNPRRVYKTCQDCCRVVAFTPEMFLKLGSILYIDTFANWSTAFDVILGTYISINFYFLNMNASFIFQFSEQSSRKMAGIVPFSEH